MPDPNNALETCLRDVKDTVEVSTGKTLTRAPLTLLRAFLIRFHEDSTREEFNAKWIR